jgi:hypothetical protein
MPWEFHFQRGVGVVAAKRCPKPGTMCRKENRCDMN